MIRHPKIITSFTFHSRRFTKIFKCNGCSFLSRIYPGSFYIVVESKSLFSFYQFFCHSLLVKYNKILIKLEFQLTKKHSMFIYIHKCLINIMHPYYNSQYYPLTIQTIAFVWLFAWNQKNIKKLYSILYYIIV